MDDRSRSSEARRDVPEMSPKRRNLLRAGGGPRAAFTGLTPAGAGYGEHNADVWHSHRAHRRRSGGSAVTADAPLTAGPEASPAHYPMTAAFDYPHSPDAWNQPEPRLRGHDCSLPPTMGALLEFDTSRGECTLMRSDSTPDSRVLEVNLAPGAPASAGSTQANESRHYAFHARDQKPETGRGGRKDGI
jgi:hypothetical protein